MNAPEGMVRPSPIFFDIFACGWFGLWLIAAIQPSRFDKYPCQDSRPAFARSAAPIHSGLI